MTQSPGSRPSPFPEVVSAADNVYNGIRTYRRVLPLVAAMQWTGDNEEEVLRFGGVLSEESFDFGYRRQPLLGWAKVYVDVLKCWVTVQPGYWIVFEETSGFFVLSDKTFTESFRPDSV